MRCSRAWYMMGMTCLTLGALSVYLPSLQTQQDHHQPATRGLHHSQATQDLNRPPKPEDNTQQNQQSNIAQVLPQAPGSHTDQHRNSPHSAQNSQDKHNQAKAKPLEGANKAKLPVIRISNYIRASKKVSRSKCTETRLEEEKLILNPALKERFDDKFGGAVRWRRECENGLPDKAAADKHFQRVLSVKLDDESRRIPTYTNHCLPLSPEDDQEKDLGLAPNFKAIDDDSIVYGVSAYYDLRTEPHRTVRVLIVAPFGAESLYCQVTCKEDLSSMLSVKGKAYHLYVMPSVSDNCLWHMFSVNCLMPQTCTPTRVALAQTPCGKPRNTFPLQYVGYFNKKTPINYSICTSTIFDFSDEKIGHFSEFVEANLLYGVERIYLYDTYNISDGMHTIINHYIKKGVIVMVRWNIPKEISAIYYFAQMLQYSDCTYRFMDETKYIGLFDVDDFFTPNIAETWHGMFEVFEKQWKLSKIASHLFSWFAVCEDPGREKVSSTTEGGGRTVDLILTSHNVTGAVEFNVKQIIAPRGTLYPHVHSVFEVLPGWSFYGHSIGIDVGLVYHYRSSHADACRNPDPKGVLLICEHVQEIHWRVSEVLYESGLVLKPKGGPRSWNKRRRNQVKLVNKKLLSSRPKNSQFPLMTLMPIVLFIIIIFQCKRKLGLNVRRLL